MWRSRLPVSSGAEDLPLRLPLLALAADASGGNTSLVTRLLPFLLPPLLLASASAAEPAPGTLREAAGVAGIEFGVAANPPQLEPGAAADLIASEFTSLTPENQLKWSTLAPAPGIWDFSGADALLDGAEANGQRLRGHTLVWGRSNGTPDWLEDELAAAPDPDARLRALATELIETVVGRYAGRIATWDVVNEPLDLLGPALDPDSPFTPLGTDFLVEAFELARAADPAATLFLNETAVEFLPEKFEGLLALVDELLAKGAPIDGVGLQGHFLFVRADGAALRAQIEQLASRGLLVEITELDMPVFPFFGVPDRIAAQAQAYAEVVEACLAVPACRGITVWGLSDADTWLDNTPPLSFVAPNRPLLFDEMLAPKPAYDAVRAALLVPEPSAGALALAALATVALIRGGASARPSFQPFRTPLA